MSRMSWRCPSCNGTWFKKDFYMKLDGTHYPDSETQDIRIYDRPGEKTYQKVYVCVECGKTLKEPFRYAR